jgi:hypothetical protein
MLGGRAIAWLAAVALIGNIVAAAFKPGNPARVVDVVLGAITICTPGGATTDGDAPTPAKHCPPCMLQGMLALAVAFVAGAWLFPPARCGSFAFSDACRLRQRPRIGGLGSRAPPFPA